MFKEILKGKTISRILLNRAIKRLEIRLEGRVYDLGSGKSSGSHYRFMQKKCGVKVVTVDIDPKSKATIITDLNKTLPINSNIANAVLAFNVIQYVIKPNNLLSESYRVLNNQGIMYCNFPFISPKQDHPIDLFRYSRTAIEYLARQNDFTVVTISGYGGRFSSAVSIFDNSIPRPVKFIIYPIVLLLDYLDKNNSDCPVGYLAVFNKKETKK